MDSEQGTSQRPAEGSPPTGEQLKAYVQANAGKFTDASLTAELLRAGYGADDIRGALAEAARESAATKSRATWTIIAAYGVTFAVLSLGMFANSYRPDRSYAPDATGGIMVLAGTLGVVLALSLVGVRRRRAATVTIGAILALPVVLLVIIAGLCVATGLPIPRMG